MAILFPNSSAVVILVFLEIKHACKKLIKFEQTQLFSTSNLLLNPFFFWKTNVTPIFLFTLLLKKQSLRHFRVSIQPFFFFFKSYLPVLTFEKVNGDLWAIKFLQVSWQLGRKKNNPIHTSQRKSQGSPALIFSIWLA